MEAENGKHMKFSFLFVDTKVASGQSSSKHVLNRTLYQSAGLYEVKIITVQTQHVATDDEESREED